ncbi:MAG: CU044_2847 family protein [Nostoc sp. DedQUE04]|uniref:CU044_2847 family protein n=1 Tax=unclassified Nostoc TaxID=2593658 RepID=UPI002AD36732|nr:MULTISPECIES: CU044_2847 family protein [unclassified Nostoc]MDZ8092194.1 CU044_2847 family protein [Nostoc sp. DedQUE05]MDZ8136824.1 CU044_2847 family protein [Nostoc sp. DedQUE04]
MSNIERLVFEEDGEIYTILFESKETPTVPEIVTPEVDEEKESYGFREEAFVKIEEVHHQIRAYTKYAIGAFKNLGAAEVEEVTLKFGLKIGGKTGIPFVTEGSAESNFEIEVKCKFPENKQNSST